MNDNGENLTTAARIDCQDNQIKLLVDALKDIREMTDPDDEKSYRADDRDGCLDAAFSVADDALAAVGQKP